jgi:homoserine kinase
MTIAWTEDGVARAIRMEASGFIPVLFIPAEQSATEIARAALPQQVPHADAAFNAARSALLVVGLTGRPEVLFTATEDRLHQNYRSATMPGTTALVSRLRGDGIAAVVSGAGSSVLALATSAEQVRLAEVSAPEAWECSVLQVAGGSESGPVQPDLS